LYFCPCVDTGRPPRAIDGDAIPLDIDVPRADAGKLRVIGSKYRTDCGNDTGHHLSQIEHIVTDQRQVSHLSFRKDVANRRTGRGQERVRGDRDLNRLRLTGNSQREIQAHLRGIPELDVGVGLSLKAGQLRLQRVDSRQEAGKTVYSGFVTEPSLR